MRKLYMLAILLLQVCVVSAQCVISRTITGSTSGCIGKTSVYTTEYTMSAYTWTVTGGTIINPGNAAITVQWTATGTQSVSVQYTDTNGCTSASPVTSVTVLTSAPDPVITGPSQVCENIEVTYTTASGMQNYIWSFSMPPPTGPGIPTPPIVGHNATLVSGGTGFNYVTLKWKRGTGSPIPQGNVSVFYNDPAYPGSCVANKVLHIIEVARPTASISGTNSVCLNGPISSTYSTVSGKSNYNWSLPSGGTIISGQGTNSIQVSWTTAGTHPVNVTYADTYCAVPATLAVTVTSLPAALTISGSTTSCTNSTVTYTADSGKPNYFWTVSAGGTIMSGAGTNSIVVKWNDAGAQSVSANYTVNGCPAPTTVRAVSVSGITLTGPGYPCFGTGNSIYTINSGLPNYSGLFLPVARWCLVQEQTRSLYNGMLPVPIRLVSLLPEV